MLRLVGLVVVAGALWSGWWFAGAKGSQAGLDAWLADRRAAGWVAEAEVAPVSGYPARFALRLSAIALGDPVTGLGWSAPEFRLDSPAWDPTDVTATFPTEQQLVLPGESIGIEAAGMTAHLALVPGPALTLRRAEVVLDHAALSSSLGWQTRLAHARLSLVRAEGGDNPYDVAFEAAEYAPGAPVLALLDPGASLPDTIEYLAIDAGVGFDMPWDRRALEERRPQPRRLDLRRLSARWGRLELEASGTLVIDAHGVPEGDIRLRAVNWREIIALAVAAGAIRPEYAGALETGLALMAGTGSDPEVIEAPLGFHGGQLTLGPVPLGPAPFLFLY